MLNSTQANPHDSEDNKPKAHASVFDRSVSVSRSEQVAGLSYQELDTDLSKVKDELQRLADKYQILDGIEINLSNGRIMCFIDVDAVTLSQQI